MVIMRTSYRLTWVGTIDDLYYNTIVVIQDLKHVWII